MTRIIDVAHWERKIDWGRAQADGVTHAIIKLSHGIGSGDVYGPRNWIECGKRGIIRAAFFWPVPWQEEPARQVEDFWQLVEALGYDRVLDWFLAADLEERLKFTPAFAKAILDELEEQSQQRAWGYTSPGFWNECVGWTTWANRFEWWIADWGIGLIRPRLPVGITHYGLWQYTKRARVDGVPVAGVDENRLPIGVTGAIYQVEVTAARALNVRAGPSTRYPILGHLLSGQLASVYDESDGWLLVSPALVTPQWVSAFYTNRVSE